MVTAVDPLAETQIRVSDWPPLRLWTVEEYHRMGEAGILHPDERVELIDGIVCLKAMDIAIDELITDRPHLADWPPLRQWTVEEYHRMDDAGLFRPDERAELIEGVICQMSPKKTLHAVAVHLANLLLTRLLGPMAGVRIQDPITLGRQSEPEPDVAVVADPNPNAYLDHHPRPEDVLLVIEVAETSLAFDRKVKGKLYARAGIPDYWILNLVDRVLEVRRGPSPEGYRSVQTYSSEATVSPLAFPGVQIPVSELLPGSR